MLLMAVCNQGETLSFILLKDYNGTAASNRFLLQDFVAPIHDTYHIHVQCNDCMQ
jgi:hypothetical protein